MLFAVSCTPAHTTSDRHTVVNRESRPSGPALVPVAAVLQHRPPAERKGSVQGAASWLSWVGISAAAVLQGVMTTKLNWTPGQIFWFCSACATVAGIYVTMTRPRAFRDMLARWTRGRLD